MKKIVFVLSLFISSIVYAQIGTPQATYMFTNGNLGNLVQTGTALTQTADRLGVNTDAVNLNGDYLRSPELSSSNKSASFWIKTTDNNATKQTIIDQSNRAQHFDNSNEAGWYAYLINGQVGIAANFKYGNANGNYFSGWIYTQATTVVADGNWNHVLVTASKAFYNSGGLWRHSYTYNIYINGVLENTKVKVVTHSSAVNNYGYICEVGNPITIGDNRNGNLPAVNTYSGIIDDIRLYTSAQGLSNAEALAAENSCLGPKNVVAGNVTQNTANITWVTNANNTSWELAFIEAGGNITNGTVFSNITGTSQAISGLTLNTSYDVYISSTCSVLGVGGGTTKITFMTPGRVYVNAAATGANNGTSWADAYTDLQVAIYNALPNDELWVVEGIYYPSITEANTLPTAVDRYFWLKNNVTVLGGFNGTETSSAQRNVLTQKATLYGEITGGFRVRHVLKVDANQTAVLDGFIVKRGYPNGTTINSGGGLLLTGSATFRNVTFTDNLARDHGGAVYAYAGASSKFISCWFQGNSTQNYDGGAVYANVSNLEFYNCVIFSNTAQRKGAAFASDNSTILLQNCTVSGNIGNASTSLFATGSGGITANQSIFSANNSSYSGGVTFSNCIYQWTETGDNINADPLFTDAFGNDLSLTNCSPAVNAVTGNPTNPYNDILGNARIVGGVMDIGAYENTQANLIDPVNISIAASSLCENAMQTLTVTGLTGISWNNGVTDGVPFSVQTGLTYTASGNNSIGCNISRIAIFTVNPMPGITASPNESICAGTQVTLTASGAGPFTWNGGISDGVAFTPTSTFSYTVTETVNSCSNSIQIQVVNIADENVNASSSTVCSGSSTTVQVANSEPGAEYFLRNTANNIIDGPISGNGNILTFNTGNLTTGTEFNVFAKATINTVGISSALDFNSANDFITLGGSNRGITTEITLATWIKTTSTVAKLFISKYTGAAGFYMQLDANGKASIRGRDGGGARASGISTTSVNDGQWHYVVATANVVTGKWRIYIEGVDESPSPNQGTGNSLTSGAQFVIGANSINFVSFPGTFDKLVIWNRELTAAEIVANANGCIPVNEAGIVGYFDFNEGTGTDLNDLSGTSGPGSFSNANLGTHWVAGIAATCPISSCEMQMTQTAIVGVTTIDNTVAQTSNTLTANLAGATYRWLDCNNANTPIFGETNQTFSPNVNGSYAVEITFGGCTAISNCSNITTISVNNLKNTSFNVYPNPVNETITLQYAGIKVDFVKIINITGKTVKLISGNYTNINVSDLKTGVYILQIKTTEGILRKRFLKE